MFFTGMKHGKPYGYAIVDHDHKTIVKGGDVMSLGQLTGLSSDQKNGQEPNAENQKIKRGENNWLDPAYPDRMQSKDMVNLLDHLIQNLEYQVEKDLRQEVK